MQIHAYSLHEFIHATDLQKRDKQGDKIRGDKHNNSCQRDCFSQI